MRGLKRENMKYHYIEVMSCPGGCINGGGQLKGEKGTKGRDMIEPIRERMQKEKKVISEEERRGILSLMQEKEKKFKEKVDSIAVFKSVEQ
jgi:iron only hydrogenase large subunit-like protein